MSIDISNKYHKYAFYITFYIISSIYDHKLHHSYVIYLMLFILTYLKDMFAQLSESEALVISVRATSDMVEHLVARLLNV